MERVYGGNDFEVVDYAFLCMTGAYDPDGLLYGFEVAGNIPCCFDATEEVIIGALDAPCRSPAGSWEFLDNCMMYGAFAKIVSRP